MGVQKSIWGLMVEVCRSEATNYFPAVEVYLISGCQCGLTWIYKQDGLILSSLYSPGPCEGTASDCKSREVCGLLLT